jgi:phosphoribosyl-AMP cyclohydrolase
MRIDDDQDAVWLRVRVEGTGASCHVGFRSCFYRAVPVGAERAAATGGGPEACLRFVESDKTFDPKEVYGDAANPTRL